MKRLVWVLTLLLLLTACKSGGETAASPSSPPAPAAQQDHVLPSHAVKGDVRVFEMTQHETLLPSPRQVLRRSQGGGQVTRGQTLPPGGVRIGGGLRCK